jgi:nicotinate-nucleotide adenylyltransferase
MNVALFGGTFDPVHRGHLAVARAAAARFQLKRVYFVPADIPPHKQRVPFTEYYHRYAMLALAASGEPNFVPSLIEANEPGATRPSYTIETVRRFQKSLGKSGKLFFLIGADAFQEIASWYHAEELLRACDFIVASRPGFSLADLADALPLKLRPKPEVIRAFKKQPAKDTIVLGATTIHVLDEVAEPVSATQVRAAARAGKKLDRLVGPAVAEYIRKQGLYRTAASSG